MTTRDDARRELKDVARLASILPRERPSSAPPGPAELGGSSAMQREASAPAVVASHTMATGQTPMPPTVLPSPPLALLAPSLPPGAAVMTIPPARPPVWRGVWAIVLGALMAIAMVSGLLVGKSLRSHPEGAASSQTVRTPIPLPAEPATSVVVAAAPTPSAVPSGPPADQPAEAASETPPAVTVKAPRPIHHGEPRSPKGVAGATATSSGPSSTAASSSSSGAAAKASSKQSSSHPAAHDTLDDLIRKAASGNAN